MAKPIVFQFAGRDLPFQLNKVDRRRLYGFKELEVLDDHERGCDLATLSGDGQTIVGRGGTAVAYISMDGLWCERGALKPVDVEGKEIQPIASTFNAPTSLVEKVTIDEFMDHDIRIVYLLESDEDVAVLVDELKQGSIFKFPFSYRGGLEADVAFLLAGDDDHIFMLVGSRVELEFVGLQQASGTAEEADADEDADADGDAMDFGMI